MRTTQIVLVALIASGLASGLAPLERDLVLFDGNLRLQGGRCAVTVYLPSGHRSSGCYMNISGIDGFELRVNGTSAAVVGATCLPHSGTATVDLTKLVKLLRPGGNLVEFQSPMGEGEFFVLLWVSDMAWYLGCFHGHARPYSADAYATVGEVLHMVDRLGGDFWALTDHNETAQNRDPDCRPTGQVQPIRGTEWTWDVGGLGHANVLGLDSSAAPLALGSISEMIDDASYLGGMVQINHPRDDGYLWGNYPVLDPGIDAIEIFNSYERSLRASNDTGSVAWWQRLLSEGHTVAATGNSDYHGYPPGVDTPFVACSRVYAPSNDPDSILKYCKLGQVMVSDTALGRRLYVYADTNGNGIMDLMMGQHVRVGSGTASMRFRVEVECASPGDLIGVFDRTGEAYTLLLPIGGDTVHEWSRVVSVRDTDFVRVELRSKGGSYYGLCTNPIYINHEDYELGPTQLRTLSFGWPDSVQPGQEETLCFRLSNVAGVSPYRFGLAVACDTALFEITGWQSSGRGIGDVNRRRRDGHEILEWRGGYPWANRLAPDSAFEYWLTLRPRTPGGNPVLFRSWADDRIFLVNRDPQGGHIGPEGESWHVESLPVGLAEEVGAQRAGPGVTTLLSPRPTQFDASCELRYYLREPAAVRLSVCDATGREVERLVDARQHEGAHSVRWSCPGLPAGVYFCEFRANSCRATAKMVKNR